MDLVNCLYSLLICTSNLWSWCSIFFTLLNRGENPCSVTLHHAPGLVSPSSKVKCDNAIPIRSSSKVKCHNVIPIRSWRWKAEARTKQASNDYWVLHLAAVTIIRYCWVLHLAVYINRPKCGEKKILKHVSGLVRNRTSSIDPCHWTEAQMSVDKI